MVLFEFVGGSQEASKEILARPKFETRFLAVLEKADLYKELVAQMNVLPAFAQGTPMRAWVWLAFLTAGRRNEVIFARKSQIVWRTFQLGDELREAFLITIPNEKSKQFPDKMLPCVKGIDVYEDAVIAEVNEFLRDLPREQDNLFPTSLDPSTFNKTLSKLKLVTTYRLPRWPLDWFVRVRFSIFPHYLRHCRLSHLSPIDAILLTHFAGWSAGGMGRNFGTLVDTYVRRDWEQIARRRVLVGV